MHETTFFFRLQKSPNEIACGHAGPGLTSTSPDEQSRSRMRVRLKAIKTGCLVRWGQSSRFLGVVGYIQGIMYRQTGMVGCGYSGGKPRHWVTITEIASLDVLVMLGEVTACVGGGTKEVSEVCWLGLRAPQWTKTKITILNNSIQGILTFERDINDLMTLPPHSKICRAGKIVSPHICNILLVARILYSNLNWTFRSFESGVVLRINS